MERKRTHIPYARLRAALDTADLRFIRAHAAELEPINLADALAICRMISDQEPDKLDRAAVRWIGRFASEAQTISIEDLRLAIDAFGLLRTQPAHAMAILSDLTWRHDPASAQSGAPKPDTQPWVS